MIMAKATGPTYNVPFKRRRRGLTNYKKRVALVKSGKPRMVVRKTGKHVIVQFVEFSNEGDKTLASANSKELEAHKWVVQNNLPTAYLTGILAANKAKKAKVNEFVLDIGLKTATKNALPFAAAKGAVDAGLKTSLNPELIDESRVKGEHIAAYAESLKGKPDYDKRFSRYIKAGIAPEKLAEKFNEVKQALLKSS